MRFKAFFAALAGAASGIIAFVISLPFLPKVVINPITDYAQLDTPLKQGFLMGTTYGWLHKGLLGFFAGLSICLIYTWNRPLMNRVISSAIGGLLGLALVPCAEWLNDQIGIKLYASPGGINLAAGLIIYCTECLLICTALCLAIVSAMGFRKGYLMRLLLAIAISTSAALAFRFVVDIVFGVAVFMQAHQGGSVDIMAASAPGFLAMDIFIGAFIGAILAVADRMTRHAWLRLNMGRNEGITWSIEFKCTRIGYQEGCEVRIQADPSVAPVHAQIMYHDNNYALVDCGTTTGTFLNGVPIQNAWLRHGDVIQIGPYLFSFNLRKPQNQPMQQGPRMTPAQIEVPSTPMGQAAAMAPTPMAQPVPIQTPYQPAPTPQSQPYPQQQPQPQAYPQQPQAQQAAQYTFKMVDSFGNGHMLVRGKMIIGREEGCDVYVSWEPTVSRRHVELTVDNTTVTLRDLGSKNGTRVNGVQVTDGQVLNNGDKIDVGNAKLTFVAEASTPSIL